MSLTISIRFLSGRAHLHPWQTHHGEGRVEWPPSHWRLLRALVAVAARGLTSLPDPDDEPPPKPEAVVRVPGMSTPRKRGVPAEAKNKLYFSKSKQILSLKERLTDADVTAWKNANPDWAFVAALDRLGELEAAPDPVAMADVASDEIPLSRLARLLHAHSALPAIWLPKTSVGHTRQYFPIHESGMVKNTGSAVFDTFAAIHKDQPLLFQWPDRTLDQQQQADLRVLLDRMTYFGRAESWCRAEAHTCSLEDIKLDAADRIVPGQTHWQCVCIEEKSHEKPIGKEYRDYLLERRLAPAVDVRSEVADLLPRTKRSDGKNRKDTEWFAPTLRGELCEKSLLRCLLRESGQDIKDELERPIGTRWVHYAVPRAVYDVPRPKPERRRRSSETVDLVRYVVNTATTHRAVLPPLTDTLLVADRFRSAAMALCREPSRALSGHEEDGSPCRGHGHAFWWPLDEDNDGFIDHIIAWAPGGFEQREVDALLRLTRLRQRGGRPDLLVSPTYVGRASQYAVWISEPTTTFVSATPYFSPLHLSHGRKSGGRVRPISDVIREGLRRQGITAETAEISEFVVNDISAGCATQDVAYAAYVPRPCEIAHNRFHGAHLKDPDAGFPHGSAAGLWVDGGTRFIRALSFCRRRRNSQTQGHGRMLLIRFHDARGPRPFAIGEQCHFGLGLFIPISESHQSWAKPAA